MAVQTIQNLGVHVQVSQVSQYARRLPERGWTFIQNFPHYVQDSRIATLSLVLANVIAYRIAKLATQCFYSLFSLSNRPSTLSQKTVEYLSLLIGYGITVGGVMFFVAKSRLPLSPYLIVGISVTTIALTIILENSINAYKIGNEDVS